MTVTRRSMAALALAAPALAQPQRAVRIIVAAAAGSAPDTACRLLTERLSALWQQPVVVENRPGAGGNIGAGQVVRADADGATLLFAHATTIVLNQHMMRAMPFDPARDLSPITLLMRTPFVLAARSGLGAGSLAEFLDLARRAPQPLTFATSGATTLSRLAGERLARIAGVPLLNVPYGGSPAALADTLADRTDSIIDGTPLVTPQLRAGTLAPLAITSAERFPGLDALPTVAESFPGFVLGGWFALMGPPALPRAHIARIAADAATVLADAALRARLLNDLGAEVATDGPEALARITADERAMLGALVAELGLPRE